MAVIGVEEGSGARVNETAKKKKKKHPAYPPPRNK